jgi:hypothetical protein
LQNREVGFLLSELEVKHEALREFEAYKEENESVDEEEKVGKRKMGVWRVAVSHPRGGLAGHPFQPFPFLKI